MADMAYPVFVNTDGTALEGGQIYLGATNADPETQPISAFWDAALTIPAAQPLRTSGGVIVRDGTPTDVFAEQPFYSIRVRSRNGAVVWYKPIAGGGAYSSRLNFPVVGGPPGDEGPQGPPGPGPMVSRDEVTMRTYGLSQTFSLGFLSGAIGTVSATPVIDSLDEGVDYTDELHQVVTLAAGGTAIMQFQPESMVGFLRLKLAANSSAAKVAFTRALQGGEQITIIVDGDSKVYGQTGGELPQNQWTATDYNDRDPNFPVNGQPGESKHKFAKIANPWPGRMQAYLRQKVGDVVVVQNRGYSGDRLASMYRRGQNSPAGHYRLIACGINNVLFATGNSAGGVPNIWGTSQWSIANSAHDLLMALARSILRGEVPIYFAPAAVKPINADTAAVNQALREYKAAFRAVCSALGVMYVDEEWSVGRQSRDFVTSDGLHWNDAGADILGAAGAAAVLCHAFDAPVIHGPTVINANISAQAVGGRSGTGQLSGSIQSITDTNALSRPFSTATGSETVLLTEGTDRFFPVWLASDFELQALPLGWTQTSTTNFHIFTETVDFGTGSTFRKQPGVEYATKGQRGPQPPIARNFADASYEKTFHHEVQFGDLPLIQGEGPHIVSVNVPFASPIGAGGPIVHLDGIKLVRPEEWVSLPLAAGFSQVGDIEPAARFKAGRVEFRGLVGAADPARGGQAAFLWPSFAGISLLPSLKDVAFSQTDAVLRGMSGVWAWYPTVGFTGSITEATLTVTAMDAGSSPLRVGSYIGGTGVTPGTYITALGSGTGGAGTYIVNASQTVASGTLAGAFRNVVNLAELTQPANSTAGN